MRSIATARRLGRRLASVRTPAREKLRSPHLLEVGLAWPPQTFLQWKLVGLAKRGLRVTVAANPPRGRDPDLPGVRVVHLPTAEEDRLTFALGVVRDALLLLLTRPRRAAVLLRAVLRSPRPARGEIVRRLGRFLCLARLDPDVVHFEWESEAVQHLVLANVWRRPTVISCHGRVAIDAHSAERAWLVAELPRAFEAATAVHCVSEAVRAVAIRLGADPAKVRLIRDGAVDPAEFHPPPDYVPDSRTLRVVAVGLLFWRKGFEYAVQAIDYLRHDRDIPVRLDVYGGDPRPKRDPSDRDRLESAIEQLKLASCVHLHGHVSSGEVRRALWRSHVLLHPSLNEGIPTAVREAMSCGLPVVVTRWRGVQEAVTDGVEGFVVATRDARAIAAALEALWADPSLRATMGAAGRRRVEAEFTLEDQLNSFEALYRELAGASRESSDASRRAPPAPKGAATITLSAVTTARLAPERSSNRTSPTLHVFSAGALNWTRGYEHAIHAIQLLVKRGVDCEYRLAGDGPYMEALMFARQELDVEDRVEVLGTPDSERLRAHLGWADVFLSAAVVDGVPEFIVDAQIAGLPTVMSDPGPCIWWPGLDAALVVARRDPHALAEKLALLARDPAFRRRLGQQARRAVQRAQVNLSDDHEP